MLGTAQRGLTLVELVIGLVITAILLAMGVPSFRDWIQNSQIRTAAEAVQNGLQLARAEAVQRNTQVSFQLTTTLDAACALSTTGPNWVVSLDDPTGACGNAPSDTVFPRIIQARAAAEGSKNAAVNAQMAGQAIAAVTFNGLGKVVVPAPPVTTINIGISNTTGGLCATAAGPMRCLSVQVSSAGLVRMCDPAVTAASDPRFCL